jgi:tetratricopeptide (TPR) repeat protein
MATAKACLGRGRGRARPRCASVFFALVLLFPSPAWGQGAGNPALREGLSLYAHGDLEAAIPALERAIQADSMLAQGYVALGSAYLGTQRYHLAELLANQGARLFPELKALRGILAESLMGLGEFRRALPLFKQLESDLKTAPIPLLGDFKMREVQIRLGQLHQLMGNQAVQRNRLADALIQFEQALRYLPDSLSVYHNTAVLHLQEKNWSEARRVTTLGLARFPDQPELLQIKGAALLQLEEYDELERVYESLVRRSPGSVQVGLTYASVLIHNQKRTRALELFETLLDRFPRDRSIYDALIEWNTRTLNFPAVLTVLRRMQREFPSDIEVMRRIAGAYEWMEEGNAARAVYDSVAALTGDVLTAQVEKARSFAREDSLDAAGQLYQMALARTEEEGKDQRELARAEEAGQDQPELVQRSEILRSLGALYERQARWSDAIDAYSLLVAADSTAYPLVRSAWSHEQLNRLDEAYGLYRKAYELGTRDPLPAYRIAVLHPGQAEIALVDPFAMAERAFDLSLQAVREAQNKMREQTQEALPAAGISLDTNPKQRKAELDRSNELAEDIFQFLVATFPPQNVEPVLLATARRYPGSGRLHYLIGRFYLLQGESAAAVRQFQEATRFAPELREAHLALGLHYATTHEDIRAIQSYERALALEPEAGDAYAALIPLYRRQNALDRLIDRWRARYRATPENRALREHLIEALHRAGRIEEAREIGVAPRG